MDAEGTPLHRRDVASLARSIAAREVSPREVLEAFVARIEARNPQANAFVTLRIDEARREADLLGDEVVRGRVRGPLHGIPIGVKDLTDTAGVRTGYGSSLFRDHVPDEDAAPVARLRAAGAVVVGKTNTHEFACGTTTDNPHWGATHNPWRHGHVPGGSSGGSGSAVAGGLVPLATGSDTGGSIRIPAALCGCVGIKPTHGRVSLRGTFPMAASCDHVGPLARTARDCAIALSAMAGFDPDDPWSRRFPPEDFALGLGRSLRGLRVGIAPGFRPVPLHPAVVDAVATAARALRDAGAEIVEVDLPSGDRVLASGGLVIVCETFAVHAERLARHAEAYGDDVRLQLEYAAGVPVRDLVRATHDREAIAREVGTLFDERIDALLMPTAPVEAPPIGDDFVVLPGGESVHVTSALASLTILHDLVRLPTVAVPAGRGPAGLPLGVQVTTAHGADSLALAIGHRLEEALWPEADRWPD
ncbi:MAG: amidase [Alphaproteobacteria bacterium]